jgi:hypothetical protein
VVGLVVTCIPYCQHGRPMHPKSKAGPPQTGRIDKHPSMGERASAYSSTVPDASDRLRIAAEDLILVRSTGECVGHIPTDRSAASADHS